MSNILKVEHLKKYYGSKEPIVRAVDDLSFDVEQGEMLAIMGASGSGKTTLLNCLSTIDTPTSGSIEFNGQQLNKMNSVALASFRQKNLGFVFQDFQLLDTLTAFENIALALAVRHLSVGKLTQKINELAELLQVGHVLKKFPHQLSGGEKQRIAIIRAMIAQPTLLLADEPSGALDSKSSKVIMESFELLNQTTGTTLVMVTHDPFSASFCKRILFMKDGKLQGELLRGDKAKPTFFKNIVDTIGVYELL